MSRLDHLTVSAALAVALPATAALADISAPEVWDDWKGYMASAGYEVTGSEAAAGGTLTVSDIVMTTDLSDDTGTGSAQVRMGEVVFAENADGTVTITLPETNDIDVTFDGVGADDDIALSALYSQKDAAMTASGSAGNVTYTYAAPEVSIALTELSANGESLPDENGRFEVTVRDIAYVASTTLGDLRSVTQDITAAQVSYDVFFEDPEGEGRFDLKGGMDGLSFKGAGDLPLEANTSDVNAMLEDGFSFDGTFATTKGGYALTFNGPDGGGTFNTDTGGGQLRVAMSPDGLTYETAQQDITMNLLLTALPLPMSFSAAEISSNLVTPLQKSDTAQDFGLAIGLRDFAMSDALWGLFDAAGQLPRDPATLILDLSGKAKLLFDVLDPAQAAILEQSDVVPGELDALTLNALELDALGAKLTGAGDFTFDNGDLATFGGFPRPQGAVDLQLVGGNALLDTLVKMGLVPENQAMGARMMMGLFAVPGEGADTLTSTIEVNDQGHVLANGQRLR